MPTATDLLSKNTHFFAQVRDAAGLERAEAIAGQQPGIWWVVETGPEDTTYAYVCHDECLAEIVTSMAAEWTEFRVRQVTKI